MNNSNLQPELKYHVVHEIMNEQVQEVTIRKKNICLDIRSLNRTRLMNRLPD